MMMINLRENYNLLVQNNIRRHNLGNIFPLLKNNCSDIFIGRFFFSLGELSLLTQVNTFILKFDFVCR